LSEKICNPHDADNADLSQKVLLSLWCSQRM